MKKFAKTFLICYVVATLFFIYFFGNMNFFGEQGFHMDIEILTDILILWAFPSALILSIISRLFDKSENKSK